MSARRVRLGADRLLAGEVDLGGRRWGLLTNYTGTTSTLELTSVKLAESTAPLVALLSPEHGVRGTVQAGESEVSAHDPLTGLPVLDTYQLSDEALDAAIRMLDIDTLLVDLQDIGARFYTYVWSMVDCLRSAARLGIRVVILDRPNPLGGVVVSGPGLAPGFDSFVGRLDVPIRHGLTIGELGRVAAALDRAEGKDAPDPEVVTMSGWRREMLWADTGLEWVLPSPNMPTPETALVFVGTALFEGTTLSEGRGTTRPFELVGAPWLDQRWAADLNSRELPGVHFRPTWFQPTFSKWAGTPVGGVQVHVTNRDTFDPLRVGTQMLLAAHRAPVPGDQTEGDQTEGDQSGEFAWREPAWEGDHQRPHFIDLLWGSDRLRHLIDDDDESGLAEELAKAAQLRQRDEALLLYERGH